MSSDVLDSGGSLWQENRSGLLRKGQSCNWTLDVVSETLVFQKFWYFGWFATYWRCISKEWHFWLHVPLFTSGGCARVWLSSRCFIFKARQNLKILFGHHGIRMVWVALVWLDHVILLTLLLFTHLKWMKFQPFLLVFHLSVTQVIFIEILQLS